MEKNEIDVLKKFMDPELVEQMIQVESGQKQSSSPRKEPDSLDELYKARHYPGNVKKGDKQFEFIEEIPDNPIPEEWMRLDNFGEIRFNPNTVRAISRRGARLSLFFDTPLLSAEFPDADLVAVFENMVKLPRRQGI